MSSFTEINDDYFKVSQLDRIHPNLVCILAKLLEKKTTKASLYFGFTSIKWKIPSEKPKRMKRGEDFCATSAITV